MHRSSVTIQVPGSTSNLGPGFDTLGLALSLFNQVQVSRAGSEEVRLVSPVPQSEEHLAAKLVADAAALFFARTGKSRFGVEVSVTGDLPVARGLGFSATVRLGVLAGLNELTGSAWDKQRLLELVTDLEGHPDNASPAVYGGFTVSSRLGATVRCLHFPVSPAARFVTLIPNFGIPTAEARKLVPESFSKADTAHNLNRAALIAAGFASGNLGALRGCFEDRVHQPYREQLIPQLSRVIRAGEAAGAIGGFLSGSGSAIICVTFDAAEQIGQAMQRELPDSEIRILQGDNDGFRILR